MKLEEMFKFCLQKYFNNSRVNIQKNGVFMRIMNMSLKSLYICNLKINKKFKVDKNNV